jgi:ABC-type transport system substrate-binding protein
VAIKEISRSKKTVSAFSILFALATGIFGAGQTSPAAAAIETLNIIAAEPSTGFDPAIAKTQASLRVMELIYDTLIDYDANGSLVPCIAESWKSSKDGLALTFKIRASAQFSDGSRITPEDVVFSLKRAAASATMKAAYSTVTNVAVSGSSEVIVALSTKDRTILNTIATAGSSAILSQKAVSANAAYFTTPKVTSGPWVLTSNVPQDRAKFDANTNYWRTGFPKIKSINYVYSGDGTANAAALEAGTQDMSFPMAPANAIRLKKAGKISYSLAQGPTMLFWGFNKTMSPFNDLRVRKAIAYLVPRQTKQDVCWEGIGPVSFGNIIFSGPLESPEPKTYTIEKSLALKRANALLTAAGWESKGGTNVRTAKNVDGVTDGTKLSFKVPFEASWQQSRCHTEMMSQAVKVAGIEAIPQAADGPTFWTEVGKGTFGMYHGGNGYPTVDSQMQSAFTCNGGSVSIMAKWCNKDFDALVAKALVSTVPSAKELYRRAQSIVGKEVPLIMVGGQYNVIGYSSKLKGFVARFDSSNRSLITSTVD